MMTRLLPSVFLCSLTCAHSVFAQEAPPVIDAFRYADDAAARAAWQPMAGTAPVALGRAEGASALRFPCNFAGTDIERASWDRQVKLDLDLCRGVQFEFHCQDASPVSYFSIYFQSGAGWYASSFYPESTGWNRVTIDKTAMNLEGRPAGWGAIQTIRISAWRGADTDTEFHLSDLRQVGVLGTDTLVALVRGDSAARTRPEEVESVQRYCAATARRFDEAGIGCATLSDVQLAHETLRRARLVVLPHNPTMPDESVDALVRYLESGGRLLAFFGMPARLRPAAKIDAGSFARPAQPGGFAALRFVGGAIPGAPDVVRQASWNILEPKPVPGASTVVAHWVDPQECSTGHAAAVASTNAIEVSHVLLGTDAPKQRQMLLAMAGYLVPEIWQRTADAAIERVGRIAGCRSYPEAATRIVRTGGADPRVLERLETTRRLRDQAVAFRRAGRYPEACAHATQAADRLLEAFAAAQRPLAGEFRAFWCHSAFGVEGMDWDAAIRRLTENGFTAILPNLLWGGVAYYPSTVLPVAPQVADRGDQLDLCLSACRKRGLQIHVWKVNWNLGAAPKEFVEQMRRAGRLQADARGTEERWLCPSHPENQKLEIDSMVEIARRYPVDGLHFDYIRYPDADHCFCAGCRERFAQTLAQPLAHWPQDVQRNGPHHAAWLDWRRAHITAVVQAVSQQARAARPGIRISAAVFRNWPADRDSIGQDWKLWCDRGYLDFVCPMDYTASDTQFENSVRRQTVWAGRVPCYPGIGAWELTPDRVIGQIEITRRLGTKGFTIFNYDARAARDLVPLLGQGITQTRW